MAVAQDAVSSAVIHSTTAAQTSRNANINLTVGSGLSNGALTVLAAWATTVSAVTARWDSAATNQLMSQAGLVNNATGLITIGTYTLVNPTAGLKNLNLTWTGAADEFWIFGASWSGVDQTGGNTSFAHLTTANTSLAGGANGSLTVTSATGNAVLAGFINDFLFATPTPCNQTQLFANNGTGGSSCANWAAGAASVSMTATNGASADNYAAIGIDIVAAAASAAATAGWVLQRGLLVPGSGPSRGLRAVQAFPAPIVPSTFQTAWVQGSNLPVIGTGTY